MPTVTFTDGHRETWPETPAPTLVHAVFRRLCAQEDGSHHGGGWVSLDYLTDAVGYMMGDTPTQETVGARCRDLRKPAHGGHIVEAVQGRRRIIPAGSPRWETMKAAEAANAKPELEQAADELGRWLHRWQHVLPESSHDRIKSMAGAILRDTSKPPTMPGQGELL